MSIYRPDLNDKHNREIAVNIGVFRSCDKAAQYIIDNIIQKDKKPNTEDLKQYISNY